MISRTDPVPRHGPEAPWHVDRDLLRRYVDGALADAAAWAVETHLTACGTCRDTVGATAATADLAIISPARLAAVRAELDDRVHAHRRSPVERLLVRAGLPDHLARLLAATPSLTRSWLLGVVVVLAAGVGAAWSGPRNGAALLGFLLLAPLVPLAGVAVAFGPRVDPTYALGVCAPISTARLLLTRALAVLVTSVAVAAVAAVALPASGWAHVAWLVPSLALTATTLAASTRWSPTAAAATVATGWVVVVLGMELWSAATLAAFRPAGQAVAMALLVASAVAVITRREHLDPAARA